MKDWQSYINFPIIKENFNRQSNCGLLVVTIAFNNLKTIDLQNKFLKKYLSDDYVYLIVDNSNNSSVSSRIRSYCRDNNISYLRPFFRLYRNASKSHGSALNFIYRSFVKKSTFSYFGFIDHDLYPVKNTSVVKYLTKQPVYGALQERAEKWYLWAGFCFFVKDYLDDKLIDFSPPEADVLDTGGMNYYSLYVGLDKSSLMFPNHKYLKICEGGSVQESNVEFADDWLHTFNASGWLNFTNTTEREKAVSKILDDLLK